MDFPGGSVVKNPSAKQETQETQAPSVGRKIPWRRKWQPTPVFLPGESHGQRSLAGYSPRGHKESDMAEHACAEVLCLSASVSASAHLCESLHLRMCLHMDTFLSLCVFVYLTLQSSALCAFISQMSPIFFFWGGGAEGNLG